MRATFVSNLIDQVAFSFEPDGLLYISKGKFFNADGNMILEYAREDVNFKKRYTAVDASETPVFVYEREDHMFLSKQPENTVFDYEIPTREILFEKTCTFPIAEYRRMQKDSLYFYIKYSRIGD